MAVASRVIIKNMSMMLDKFFESELNEGVTNSELSDVKEVMEKFSLRYIDDKDVQYIYDEFMEYLKYKDIELMERITNELEELVKVRRLESLIMELKLRDSENVINVT